MLLSNLRSLKRRLILKHNLCDISKIRDGRIKGRFINQNQILTFMPKVIERDESRIIGPTRRLHDCLESDVALHDKYLLLMSSLSSRQKHLARRFRAMPDRNPPPVFTFTPYQMGLYQILYEDMDPTQTSIAEKHLGRPFEPNHENRNMVRLLCELHGPNALRASVWNFDGYPLYTSSPFDVLSLMIKERDVQYEPLIRNQANPLF